MYEISELNVSQKYNNKIIKDGARWTDFNDGVFKIRFKLFDD